MRVFTRWFGKQKRMATSYINFSTIVERNTINVEEKSRIGDWEADTVIGANHKGDIVTFIVPYTFNLKLNTKLHGN
jgi:IS30 family transposase